ncbi:hypothetical protein FQN52_007298 [Onygenales sp. PD_12]|nr:hypothetical protein FQN52_007298 [Onygenales sp. PD_12]
MDLNSLPPELAAWARGLQQRTQAAEARAESAEARVESAEARIRPTTFAEFLEACHQQISIPLRVEPRPEFTTKGTITRPNGRLCPTSIKPWDFRALALNLFDDVYRMFHPPSAPPRRAFPSIPVLEDRGHQACQAALTSELDLVKHQMFEVEIPVREVIEQLIRIPEARGNFALGEGVLFSNHVNSETEEPGEFPPRPSDAPNPRADQNCVFLEADNTRRLVYIIEYKAAHKLTDVYLRAGLRPMNMWEEVVQRLTIPTDPVAKLQYNAENLSCAAVTQVFDYMIKGGLEYGILTNGGAKVMLRIPEENPFILEYCLLEPRKDVEDNIQNEASDPDQPLGFRYLDTAVGSHVALTLMALQSHPRSQQWRSAATNELHRWEVDFDALVRTIPDEEREMTPPASEYRPPHYPLNPNSSYIRRTRRTRNAACSNPDPPENPGQSSSGSDSDAAPTDGPQSPSVERQERRTPQQRRSKRQRRMPPAHAPQKQPNSEYCTQKCLLGLINRMPFDDACPNIQVHRQHSGTEYHPIDGRQVTLKLERQLNNNPDHCCRPLPGKEGLHGALFALTLDPYGYTFVGKGTTYSSNYESKVYEHLRSVQGSAIPVYLGDIYLTKSVYYLRPDYVIVHMGLMAWGGQDFQSARPSHIDEGEQIARTRDEINAAGIEHLDEGNLNMLWNEELQRVLFIDFGRVRIVEQPQLKRKLSVLKEIDSNDAHVEKKAQAGTFGLDGK